MRGILGNQEEGILRLRITVGRAERRSEELSHQAVASDCHMGKIKAFVTLEV